MIRNGSQGTKVSRPIVRISVISISLAIVVNLITIAIVTGFQHEVREKITGFNAPLFISKKGTTSLFECEPIHKNQTISKEISYIPGVRHVQQVAYKPALLQSLKFEDKIHLANGKDSIINRQEIAGVLMKGVDAGYDWHFIKKNLKVGRLPRVGGKEITNEIILSEKICKQLNFELNQDITAFYVKNQPVQRPYKLVGIYNTGLEEYDKKMVFCDLREVQKMNDYGLSASIELEDTLTKAGSIVVKANLSGNLENLVFDWGNGPDLYSGYFIQTLKDTTIRLIVFQADFERNKNIPLDTAYLKIRTPKGKSVICRELQLDEDGNLIKKSKDENSYFFSSKEGKVVVTSLEGKGSAQDFVAGMEVQISDWDNLSTIQTAISKSIEMRPTKHGELLQVRSILDNESDLFAWLSFLDYNVLIIVFLMLIIGIINVGSAMLVLIVMRSNFIGMLKAMGATNWSIRKIFLYQAAFLIARGMIIGNVIGVSLCLLQAYFGFVSLDPTVYFLDTVPVELTFFNWFLINLITFSVCMIALIIPSYVVTRISPAKSIKFN